MRRRQFLAATTGTGLSTLAGCVDLGREPTSLGSPSEETEKQGLEKHLVFTHESDDFVVITLDRRLKSQYPDRLVPIRFHVWHRAEVSVDRLLFKIRSPNHPTHLPGSVYVAIPDGGPWPKFDLRKAEDSWTIIGVDDIGTLGDGSMTLDLIIDPIGETLETLAVETEVDLFESGILQSRYRASTATEFDIGQSSQ